MYPLDLPNPLPASEVEDGDDGSTKAELTENSGDTQSSDSALEEVHARYAVFHNDSRDRKGLSQRVEKDAGVPSRTRQDNDGRRGHALCIGS